LDDFAVMSCMRDVLGEVLLSSGNTTPFMRLWLHSPVEERSLAGLR